LFGFLCVCLEGIRTINWQGVRKTVGEYMARKSAEINGINAINLSTNTPLVAVSVSLHRGSWTRLLLLQEPAWDEDRFDLSRQRFCEKPDYFVTCLSIVNLMVL
jgi:hypothetical protein